MAEDNSPVDRYLLPGLHYDYVSCLHILYGYLYLPASAENARFLGLQAHELLYCLGGAAFGSHLEYPAEEDERYYGAGCVKIKGRHSAFRDEYHGKECDRRAVEIRG